MASINGRRVRFKDEDGSVKNGRVVWWQPGSSWLKVLADDGFHKMIHETDWLEIIRTPES